VVEDGPALRRVNFALPVYACPMNRLDWESEVRPVLVAAYRALGEAGSTYPNVMSEDINTQLERRRACREPDTA